MKRCLSLLMALILVLSLFPAISAHANSEDANTESASENDASDASAERTQLCTTVKDAIDFVRSMLRQHVAEFTVQVPMSIYYGGILDDVLLQAVEHTRDPKEGDSLLWQMIPLDLSMEIDAGYAHLNYGIIYLTTVGEEAELDAAMDALLQELSCDPADSYDSVKKVYDWVCANVAHENGDSASLYGYTAYGAMINRTAAYQGYALLIYQLLCKLGIDCRVVPGERLGQEHAWNLVLIDGSYYNVDASLDAGCSEYGYFLKSDASFENHERNQAYDYLELPNAWNDYTPQKSSCELFGHIWNVGTCTEPVSCDRCGLKSEEFGPHDFGAENRNCENPRVCLRCGEFVPPGEHVYADEMDHTCDRCGHSRILACAGVPFTVSHRGQIENGPPRVIADAGIAVSLVRVDDWGSPCTWDYELVIQKVGSYRVRIEMDGDEETQIVDIAVFNHTYCYDNSRLCSRCYQENENYHSHTWIEATCMAPRTCSGCGETEGDIWDHRFYTAHCTTEPGACVWCGLSQETPPGHAYRDSSGGCTMCGQVRRIGCTEGGAVDWVNSQFPDGFQLVDTDPRITISENEHGGEAGSYYWEYVIKAPDVGRYEVSFADKATGNVYTVTADIRPHEYVDGRCWYCNETDPTVHFHDWKDATCTEPQTCTECGATEGYAWGHEFEDGPCTKPRTCARCGLVIEAPSHYYWDDSDIDCNFCGQQRYETCEGTGIPFIFSSIEGGDWSIKGSAGGFSLVLMEFFLAEGVYYWEYLVYPPGAGSYEISLSQKGSDESLSLTLYVSPHEYLGGICWYCGNLEEGGHTHTWKSATCKTAAVCAECGETEGTPLNHDFSAYSCTESAWCARCNENRRALSHTYDDRADEYCNLCNQYRITCCEGDKPQIALVSTDKNGFYLKNPPSSVSMEREGMYSFAGIYEHYYTIKTPGPGNYELLIKDAAGGEPIPITVEVFPHEFVDGNCAICGKWDEISHIHQWMSATCLEPMTCETCGATQGEPNGHFCTEATCTMAWKCWDCGLTEGEPLGHDFLEWSCSSPGVCRRCNLLQETAPGHSYDDDLDAYCNRCGQFRLVGCEGADLTVQFASDSETPFTLSKPETGVTMVLEECLEQEGQFVHTYRIQVTGVGTYELTATQEGNPEPEVFTVQLLPHSYVDDVCRFCGAEFEGLLGDVTGDGKINYSDALLILRASIMLETLSETQMALADANRDGNLNYNDALLVLRASIGLELPLD